MRSLGIALLLLPGPALIAQQAEVTRYDVAQGLPQSMVNHVLQDREGFIWLGTGDGLARFDGHNFVVYKSDPRDSTSLSHNAIWSIAERDEHYLWVGTRSGLDLLDRRTGQFEHIHSSPATQDGCWRPLRISATEALFYSPLCTALLTVNAQGAQRTPLHHSSTHVLHCDPRTGTLTQMLGLDTLLTRTGAGVERVALLPNPEHQRITDLVPLGDRWLILSLDGAWTWSEEEGRRALPAATAAHIARSSGPKFGRIDADGNLWLGLTGTGVLVLNDALQVVRVYPLLPENERPLNITALSFDHQGNTWVGTDGKGVFSIAPQRIKFGRCMPGQGSSHEPTSWFVRGFAQWDADHVLVSFYEGGLALFSERTSQLSPLELASDAEHALEGKDFQHPFKDRNGLIWGGDQFHVFAIDPRSKALAFSQHTPTGNALLHGADGSAMIFTHAALRSMGHVHGTVVEEQREAPQLLHFFQSRGLIPEKLFMTAHGAMLCGQTILPIHAWQHDVQVPIGPFLPDVRLTAMIPVDTTECWITSNDGLYRMDPNGLVVNGHWTIHDGLPDQYLYGMLPGNDGTWWISSNKGLSHFAPQTNRFSNFTTRAGLQSSEFNSHAYFRSASGRLYFGGVNGFNHFLPGTPTMDTDIAHVSVIGLTAQDETIDLSELDGAARVTLPHDRNNLRIDLAVLEFTAPQENSYRYRISGYSDWLEQPAAQPILLTNIPAGTYTVEVSGINGDGHIAPPRTVLAVHVPLPFSSSPLAFVLGGALVVGCISAGSFLLYRLHIKRQLELAAQEMKELRIRARIAQDLHDDLGSGLARITALSRTATRNAGRGDDVLPPMAKLTELTQELLHGLGDVVWVNDPRGGPLAELLLRIGDHVQDLFEGSACTVDIRFPQPLPERPIGPLAKRNLFLIAKEAAHNACKYSGATEIVLHFRLDPAHFAMELNDNGTGQLHVAGSGGHGMRNMHARAVEIGCTLQAGNRESTGYQIALAGPLAALDL